MSSRRPPLSLVVLISWLLVAASACGKGGGASGGSSPTGEGTSSLPPGAIPLPSGSASTAPPSLAQTAPSGPAIVTAEGTPISFAPLAKKADPAVATVKARVEKETSSGRRRAVSEGLGTAFVYDPEGFMLTNNHVIEDATDIVVGFIDGREMRATVVGRDKHTDIAVLRVDERGLPSLSLGDSDGIDVGDWVVAIGNPFGLSHTVSAGILSAKGRTRDDVKGLDPSGYFNFLQTDASINPGNSGGPLLNMRGEVVGINAAVRANANNIGFAIPINMVKQLLPMLLRDGKIRRSALGVFVDALNPIEAGRLRRPDRKGAWVQKVIAGGPADRAGLSPDDVIVSFDGKPVSDPNELRWLASIAGVNKTVTLRISRIERVFDVRVTLGELEPIDDREEP
ncbi:trypsin-like peptidase domain-containing protein [Polyangium sp. 6x1]|uniref:S1C family serine protease n=1 Tax=Polyangium sp. 6x1 TaxID=3042689 RepID=UPI0024828FE3|nr:trypsin-like peptidase domain-containing protein [Polyangium sp. 6x1]MDI1448238.1 trypsin-like peptidase domain-containing protein [Polyangium sp. 6x1]